MVLVEAPEAPDAFRDFARNSDDPGLHEALRALREEVNKESDSSEPAEKDPLDLACDMSSFRVTKGGRFRPGELLERAFPNDQISEANLERHKARAIRFEEYELEICTGCRRTKEQIQRAHSDGECHCKNNYARNRAYDEAEKAKYEAIGEKARLEIPSWVTARLALRPPEFKKVKFTKVFEPYVEDRGPWLREKLSTEITF